MAQKKTETAAQKELKTIKESIKKLIGEYESLQKDFTKHVVTPDAHNPGVMSKRIKK